jgi:hypothetical protein
MHKKYTLLRSLLFAVILPAAGCIKTPVTLEDNNNGTDPDLVYIDDYKVELGTYKLDSFITSGHNVFTLGTHADPLFSKISANSYAEIELPPTNPLKSKEVLFDSLVMVLVPTGIYYGDTTLPVKLSVHPLTQNIQNDDDNDNNYYYPRQFAHQPAAMAQVTTVVKPKKRNELLIRLPDALGQDWMMKLKQDATEISNQDKFRQYFKGLCIKTDSLYNKTLYCFGSGAGQILIRLHYRERGITTTEKQLDFKYVVAKQFNNITYNSTGTPFAPFSQFKKQLKAASLMDDRVYVSTNMPSYVKISFPGLLAVKELHPYVKIIQAELEIKPAAGTARYPYRLPPQLQLYVSNYNNSFDGILSGPGGQAQNGSLFIDDLYGANTRYRFDVTQFVNTVLEEGRFSTKALMLGTVSADYDDETSRLVINDRQGDKGIKLKLYVLGL